MRARIGRLLAIVAVAIAGSATAGPIVQPGAPGQPSRTIDAGRSRVLGETGFVPADVRFYQDMIMHHAQAIEMVGLVEGRTSNSDLTMIAKRIALGQSSEMAIMRAWLTARGQSVESMHAHHAMVMNGMLSPAQMAALRAATGPTFDRLFLTGMIQHHKGAIQMVADLNANPAAGKDPDLNDFVTALVPDQSSEILIMQAMLRKTGG